MRHGMGRFIRQYRYHILVLLIVTLVFARVGLAVLLPSSGGPMGARYDKIALGMTIEEAEDILGKPNLPDNHGTKTWVGEGGIIMLTFRDGRVAEKYFGPLNDAPTPRFPR
jgi:hypothetical protein